METCSHNLALRLSAKELLEISVPDARVSVYNRTEVRCRQPCHATLEMRIPIIRFFYSTTYTVILIITLGLLLISPGDGIYQSYRNEQLWNVVIIAGTYLLTALVATFIYATRIYTTRQHLASIPRSYIPVRKGDVSTAVRKLIEDGLARSAAIAYNAHPRNLEEDENSTPAEADVLGATVKSLGTIKGVPPPWGTVSHPGWSSPSSEDIPHVHFEPVLQELPHLIEAKAVSLAPPDPLYEATSSDAPEQRSAHLPDPNAVSILQRPAGTTLRDYLAHLSSLSMLNDLQLQNDFLVQYERARFSAEPQTESQFRSIMATFSALLRSMKRPEPAMFSNAFDSVSSGSTKSSIRPSSVRPYSQASSILHKVEQRRSASEAESSSVAQPLSLILRRPHPGSVSSNDGDHDDSGSERTAHTAWTRQTRQAKGGQRSASRYTADSSTYKTPATTARSRSMGTRRSSTDSREKSELSDDGNVIRKIPTGDTGDESLSGQSVMVNRGTGGALDLPVVMDET